MPRWPNKHTRERIIALREAEPSLTGAEIARRLGISAQRASQLLRELGLPLGAKRWTRRTGEERQEQQRAGYWDGRRLLNGNIPGIASGACGELLVCIDLLRRGCDVFRSVSSNARCDLIAARRSGPTRSIRIEVKVGSRGTRGQLSYSRPSSNQFYDLLAVATAEGIVYLPNDDLLLPPDHGNVIGYSAASKVD